jgi:hypothetical protein
MFRAARKEFIMATATQEPKTSFFCIGCGTTNPADQDPTDTRSCTACTHLVHLWQEAGLQLERALKPLIDEWQARWQARGMTEEITRELIENTLEDLVRNDQTA